MSPPFQHRLMKYTSTLLGWYYFLWASFFGRYAMALLPLTSLVSNVFQSSIASHNGLLRPLCRNFHATWLTSPTILHHRERFHKPITHIFFIFKAAESYDSKLETELRALGISLVFWNLLAKPHWCIFSKTISAITSQTALSTEF